MQSDGPLYANDSVVIALQTAVRGGGFGLANVPELVVRVIREHCWQERIVKVTREHVRFSAFEEFVCRSVPDGLGSDVDTIKALCRDHFAATDLIDRATSGRQGERTDLVSNAHEVAKRPASGTRQRAIRSLRTARPDLHEQVLAGRLSPHGAMVAAGLRRPTVTLPLEPLAIARTLRRRLTPEQLAALVTALAAPAS